MFIFVLQTSLNIASPQETCLFVFVCFKNQQWSMIEGGKKGNSLVRGGGSKWKGFLERVPKVNLLWKKHWDTERLGICEHIL